MRRSDFSYDLPQELIAQIPAARGESRMMIADPQWGTVEHSLFRRFPDELTEGDVLVLNDTRVIPARLLVRRSGMSRRIEILLTRNRGGAEWEALCRPARRIRAGDRFEIGGDAAIRVDRKLEEGGIVVTFVDRNDQPLTPPLVDQLLQIAGVMPLPPYIRRETAREEDRTTYQSVYAARAGAVAAPTAGLHFSAEILEQIAARGVEIVRVTLHVGSGTFKPVKVEELSNHRMDVERYEISDDAAESINQARRDGRRIVAVGTTSVRTLESACRDDGTVVAGSGDTSLFITPGYTFRLVDALLTNFHLPESTLLMLVAAFAGHDLTMRAYREAIDQRYRFYSYGDCMFVRRRSGE